MVCRFCAKFCGKFDCSAGCELVCMDAQFKATLLCCHEYALGLRHAEDLRFAEDIAELGKLFFGYTRKHLMDDEVYIAVGLRLVFVRNFVRSQKRRNAAQWRAF